MALMRRPSRQEADLCLAYRPEGPPAKKLKSRNNSRGNSRSDSRQCPPQFWDRLSKIELTRRALGEFDRRTERPSSRIPLCFYRLAQTPAQHNTRDERLAQFSRHGGPDLSDLRGYPYPEEAPTVPGALTSNTSLEGGDTRSANPPSTQPTSTTTKSKRSTAYSRNFEQHLTDHNIKPVYSSEEPYLDEIFSTLAQPRPSLSPSKFSEGAFKVFRQNNDIAEDEGDVLENVMPTIIGPSTTTQPCGRNTTFGNLEPLTDGTIAPARPEIYYGSPPEQLSQSVRERIGQHIVPSSMHDKPLAPNFFVEVKGPDGSAAVAARQARYDGAVGSRAMHSLQNYGRQPSQYDGQARTLSTTYHNGQLQIYAHHVTAPANGQGQPGYHMTQVDAWAMTGNRDGFVRGATAFRNARDLAKQHRDALIRAANSRTSATTIRGDSAALGEGERREEGEGESADEFVDCEEPAPRTPTEDSLEATDIDEHHRASLLPGPGDIVTSFTSSFTSEGTANEAKRQRRQLSPDSKVATRSPPSKVRQRRGTDRQTQGTSSAGQSSADKD